MLIRAGVAKNEMVL